MLHHIINFTEVHHHIEQCTGVIHRERILAHQIVHQTIGYNPVGTHGASLIAIIETLVKRIIFTHILVKADAQYAVGQNDGFIECRNLCVYHGDHDIRHFLLQFPEAFGQLFLDRSQFGISGFHILYQTNQSGVRIECFQSLEYMVVTYLPDGQYIFNQQFSRQRIFQIHFL